MILLCIQCTVHRVRNDLFGTILIVRVEFRSEKVIIALYDTQLTIKASPQ